MTRVGLRWRLWQFLGDVAELRNFATEGEIAIVGGRTSIMENMTVAEGGGRSPPLSSDEIRRNSYQGNLDTFVLPQFPSFVALGRISNPTIHALRRG